MIKKASGSFCKSLFCEMEWFIQNKIMRLFGDNVRIRRGLFSAFSCIIALMLTLEARNAICRL